MTSCRRFSVNPFAAQTDNFIYTEQQFGENGQMKVSVDNYYRRRPLDIYEPRDSPMSFRIARAVRRPRQERAAQARQERGGRATCNATARIARECDANQMR